jgi:hypothetical protein
MLWIICGLCVNNKTVKFIKILIKAYILALSDLKFVKLNNNNKFVSKKVVKDQKKSRTTS